MRATEFIVETAMMGKIADSGKIIRILKKAHTVPFSDEKNWLLVDTDPGKGNSGLGIKWISADTRFEWVRPYKDSVDENLSPQTIHKLADHKGVKWDDEPSFLQLTKRLTGKEHLDDLDQAGLNKVKKHLDGLQGVAESDLDKYKKYIRPVVKTTPKIEKDNTPSGRTTDHIEWKVTSPTGEIHRYSSKKQAQAKFDSFGPKGVAEGEVVPFPKKHPYELLTNCPKCGGSLQGGKDEKGRLKMCIPCMTLYRAPIQQGVAEEINSDVFNPAFNDTQIFDELTYRATAEKGYNDKTYFQVKVLDSNFQQVGLAKFSPTKRGLVSAMTWVHPEYQGQGLARNIYAYVRSLGNTIAPSRNQLPAGKAMWASWKKSGDAKYLMKDVAENFADGRNPEDKGDSKRHGINTRASVSSLRKTAKSGGRKGQLAHWLANMKSGRAKAKSKNETIEQGLKSLTESEPVTQDYMAGHCHVMAIALKMLHPDWQIRAHVGWDDDAADDTEYRVDHVYTVAPDGSAYDCRGRFDSEETLVGQDATGGVETQYADVDLQDIKQLVQRGELKRFTRQDIDSAMRFAKQIGQPGVAEGWK